MEKKDLVTYRPKLLMYFEPEHYTLFEDENLNFAIKYLRKGPATISEIAEAFKECGKNKSESTVYRYVKRLVEAKLAVKAGKRITSTSVNNIQSETLYSRSSVLFIVRSPSIDMKNTEGEDICKLRYITQLLLEPLWGSGEFDSKCFYDFTKYLDEERRKVLFELFEQASDEAYELINETEFKYMSVVLDLVGWFGLFKKVDIEKELSKCFQKKS